MTHREGLHKNRAFREAHRNFFRKILPQRQAREGASPFPSRSGSGDCPARRGIAIVRLIVSSLAKNGMTGD